MYTNNTRVRGKIGGGLSLVHMHFSLLDILLGYTASAEIRHKQSKSRMVILSENLAVSRAMTFCPDFNSLI